jgi:hypothetical protein
MNDFAIKPAERKATPSLICLWGPSGSGKTFSALRVARGLVGPTGKIGLIDTENRRAEFYADIGKPWDHLDFQPPFTPQRYIEALRAFETQGGYGCIIVDSMSHIWEGEGGVLDMADSGRTQSGKALRGLAKWNAPKMAYKRALNYLLRAPFHVIFCLRAKQGVRQKPGGEDAIEHVGLEPICEKNFIYEQTVSVLLGPDHRPLHQGNERFYCNPMIPAVKAPAEIWSAIKPGEFLSEATGEAIADWIGGGAAFDSEGEQLIRVARDVATMGLAALEKHWRSLNKTQQKALKPNMEEIKAIAVQADEEARQPGEDREDDGDPFADKFSGGTKEQAA